MRKTKLLLVAFLAMLGSSVSAAVYVIDQKFTSISELDGILFSIVNETDGKAIYNSGAQNLGYDPYGTAVTGTSYQWVLESLDGAEDEEVHGCYALKVVKSDGSNVELWGNSAIYLNSGAPGGFNGCFVLGQNNQYGTDVKYGGVWEVEYVDGNGFTLKNKAREGYFAGVNPAPTGSDPVYWTFCTLKEDVVAGWRENYNKKKEQVLAISSSIDISEAEAKMASAATEDDVNAAIASLVSALADYLTTASNVNVSDAFITNPSFESSLTGWTNNGMQAQGNTSFEKTGNTYCEAWQPNGTKSVSQILKNLPQGKYKLTAKSKARGVTSAKLYAGKTETAIEISDNTNTYSVEFACKGDITIGFEGVGTGAGNSWLCVDDFQLTFIESITDDELAALELAAVKAIYDEALAAAKAFDQNSIPSAANSSLQSIISANDNTYYSEEDYNAAIAALNNAVAEANKLVKPYTDFKTLKAIADDLVSAGTDNASGQSALSSVISTQSSNADNAETAEAINTAYADLKEEMTTYANSSNPVGEGEKFNMTFMLTNPDLTGLPTWQKADGWYTEQDGGNSQVMVNDNATSVDKTKTAFFEYWANPAKANDLFALYLKVTLPEGTYNMSCYAFAQDDGVHVNRPNGVYFYANDVQGSAVNNARLTQQSIEFVNESEQEVKIGLKTVTGNTNYWMGIGYVELFKVPNNTIELDEDVAYEPESKAGKVTLKKTIQSGWNTVVLPFGVTAEQIASEFGEGALYKYTGDDEEGVLNFESADVIAPNTPYLFNSTGSAKSEMEFAGVTVSPGTPTTAGTNFDFVGTYEPITSITSNDYVLGASAFVKAKGGNALKAFRAYIQGKEESAARELLISIDGEVTAIETIDGKKVNSNAAIYNLAGQKVKKAQKGIFIQDGKKVIVK